MFEEELKTCLSNNNSNETPTVRTIQFICCFIFAKILPRFLLDYKTEEKKKVKARSSKNKNLDASHVSKLRQFDRTSLSSFLIIFLHSHITCEFKQQISMSFRNKVRKKNTFVMDLSISESGSQMILFLLSVNFCSFSCWRSTTFRFNILKC